MKPRTLMPLFIGALFMFASAFAAPGRTTYQAKIIKPDGLPLEGSNVSFRFTILDPLASCVLYVENYTAINMADGGGLVSFSLGMGTRTFPVSGTSSTFSNTFDNSTAVFNCQTTGTYNPSPEDNRKIVMQFNDGTGWQTLPAMAINAVPYAMYAGKSDNSIQLNGKSDSAFVEYSTLAGLSCAADQAIKFNGVSFSCITVGSGGGGGVTSVTTSGTVLSTGGTASAPVISIQAATMSQDGYLTSLDYAEFKGKLSASATQITNTLGYAPVSGAAVATQINNTNLSGDVSGTISSNSVISVGGKTAAQISASVNDTQAATSSATADTIVKRNASGNSTFNDIYANAAKINYVDIYKPSTSFNVRLQAPTSLSTNYILNLPTTSGTTGQVLSTDGAGNLSWINSSTGSVVSVSATAPLASTGGSTPTISISQATSSTSGYLSSTDWNTFNNKQAATSAAIIATLGYTPANSATTVSSQWTTSGTDIYYNTGKVGVGTTVPNYITQIHNSAVNSDAILQLTNGSTGSGVLDGFRLGVGTDNNAYLRMAENAPLYIGTNNTNRVTVAADGNVGIGTTAPSAKLHLAAGTSSTAPLKLTSGTLLTSPQSGTMEYDGTNFYLTDSINTRRAIATGSGAGTIDNASTINSTGNISMVPVGSVIVSSTTASTSSNTGALVVKGGLGVAGTANIAQNLNVSGSSVIDGALRLSSMTGGSLLFAGASGTLSQDNSALYWDEANKRLGVGSNSPSFPLDVQSSNAFQARLFHSSNNQYDGSALMMSRTRGTLSSNTAVTSGDTIGGIYFRAHDGAGTGTTNSSVEVSAGENHSGTNRGTYMIFETTTNGSASRSEKMRIHSNGNVGIGTTSPQSLLQISRTAGSSGNLILDGNSSSTGKPRLFIVDTNGGSVSTSPAYQIYNTNDLFSIGRSSNINTGPTDIFNINNSGNVGIGTTTPIAKTSIATSQSSPTSVGLGMRVYETSGNYGVNIGAGTNYGWIQGLIGDQTTTGYSNIALNPNGGNVGIGTSTPTAPLTVSGGGTGYPNLLVVDSSTSPGGSTVVLGNNAISGDQVRIGVNGYLRSTAGAFGLDTTGAITPMTFSVNNTEQMRVHTNGYVGIGTATPAYKLEVNGSLNATSIYVNGSQLTSGIGSAVVNVQVENVACSTVGELARDASNSLMVCDDAPSVLTSTSCTSPGGLTFDSSGGLYVCAD